MTHREILVGLLDSGIKDLPPESVEAQLRFVLQDSGEVGQLPAGPDALGHGTELARILRFHEPRTRIVNAQIFTGSFATSAVTAAAGLCWLIDRKARLINMSFGLKEDRVVLRDACATALQSGAVLLAAAVARGAAVYPAAYPGVIRITGDARCAPGEMSALGTAQADFGAHVRAIPNQDDRNGTAGGASYAVAHAAGIGASFLLANPGAGAADVLAHFEASAVYRGAEHRSVKGGR